MFSNGCWAGIWSRLSAVNRVHFKTTETASHWTLDDQTQVDSKQASQPEHANLNLCQLIAAN